MQATPCQVASWLRGAFAGTSLAPQLDDYCSAIILEEVDGETLSQLEKDDLKDLGIDNAVHRIKIIQRLKKKLASAPAGKQESFARLRHFTAAHTEKVCGETKRASRTQSRRRLSGRGSSDAFLLRTRTKVPAHFVPPPLPPSPSQTPSQVSNTTSAPVTLFKVINVNTQEVGTGAGATSMSLELKEQLQKQEVMERQSIHNQWQFAQDEEILRQEEEHKRNKQDETDAGGNSGNGNTGENVVVKTMDRTPAAKHAIPPLNKSASPIENGESTLKDQLCKWIREQRDVDLNDIDNIVRCFRTLLLKQQLEVSPEAERSPDSVSCAPIEPSVIRPSLESDPKLRFLRQKLSWNDSSYSTHCSDCTPSPPTDLKVSLQANGHLNVKFDPPCFDGGHEICAYVIKCDLAVKGRSLRLPYSRYDLSIIVCREYL